MSKIIVPSSIGDNWYSAEAVMLVDKLIKLKRDNQTNVWVVIDEIIKIWKDKYPTSWKSFIVTTEKTRDSRANKYGSNDRAGLRYTVDMPEWVHNVIRRLYDPSELAMDKKFFREFWKRYPVFRVSESS